MLSLSNLRNNCQTKSDTSSIEIKIKKQNLLKPLIKLIQRNYLLLLASTVTFKIALLHKQNIKIKKINLQTFC